MFLQGDERLAIIRQDSSSSKASKRDLIKELRSAFGYLSKSKLVLIEDPVLDQELLKYEDRQARTQLDRFSFFSLSYSLVVQSVRGVKIGVLLCKEGQTKEEEMFSNGMRCMRAHAHAQLSTTHLCALCRRGRHPSPPPLCLFFCSCGSLLTSSLLIDGSTPGFDEFLKFLGEEIPLQGFAGFRGGLDVRTNTTGSKSVYTLFCGVEIMFHVSTMLPFSPVNEQQVRVRVRV